MKFAATAFLAGAIALTAGSAFAQDATKGQAVFKKCAACHRVGPDAKNVVGPVLNGVVGRPAASYEGYAYSEVMKVAGANGLVWDEAQLTGYLADPTAHLKKFLADKGQADAAKGNSKMVYKLPNEQERKDVIAYLATQK